MFRLRTLTLFSEQLQKPINLARSGVLSRNLITRATPRPALRVAITPPKRTIINVADLNGTFHPLLLDKHQSPIDGAVFSDTRGIHRLYEIAQKNEQLTATNALVSNLFYKQGEQFRSTRNKTNSAYSLTPSLLADIMHHLNAGTLDNPEVRAAICDNWNKQHVEATGSKTTLSKMNLLLDRIIASKHECIDKKYPLHLTELILLSFLHHKASTRKEVIQFLNRMKELNPAIEREFSETELPSNNDYVDECIQSLNSLCANEAKAMIADNFERILLSLMMAERRLGRVDMDYYGYNGKEVKPNCVENGFNNLCNLLLYNETTGLIDFTLLPEALKVNPNLLAFYANEHYHTSRGNLPEVQQTFFNMLCGQAGFIYRSGDYNLISTTDNFIPVMNYLFGTSASSLDELSLQMSNKHRQIKFSISGKEVKIEVKGGDVTIENMQFIFNEQHSELFASYFHKRSRHRSVYQLKSLKNFATANLINRPMLYTLLDYASQDALLPYKAMQNQSIDCLNALMIFHEPRTAMEAVEYVELFIPHLHGNSVYETYIFFILNKSPMSICEATKSNKLDIVQLCLKAGINPDTADQFSKAPLHYATNTSMLTTLLEAGANPGILTTHNESPLHELKFSGAAATLLRAGANPNIITRFGKSPLHTQKCFANVEALIAADADLNAKDCNGCTPLHFARGDILTLLINAGANPNVADGIGRTPLHNVTDLHRVKDIRVLLNSGARPDLADIHGWTPLSEAKEPEVLAMMREAVAAQQSEANNFKAC